MSAVSRRRALAWAGGAPIAVLAGGALGGCDLASGGDSTAPTDAEVDADRDLAASVRADLAAALALVQRARVGSTGEERRRLTALLAVRRRHVAALAASPDSSPDPSPPTPAPTSAPTSAPTRRADVAAVRTSEERLQRRLLTACVAANEPRFAMLLGALAAGTAQQSVQLSDQASTQDPGAAS